MNEVSDGFLAALLACSVFWIGWGLGRLYERAKKKGE